MCFDTEEHQGNLQLQRRDEVGYPRKEWADSPLHHA